MTSVHLGVTSPVVEVFVRGGLPRDVRLLAARGQAAADRCDRLALLALMTEDDDGEVAAVAASTVDAIPAAALATVLAHPDVPAPLRAWYTSRRALAAPGTAISAETPDEPAVVASGDPAGEVQDEEPAEEVLRLLTSLPVPEKIKIATLGRREQRAILIRDPNRIVSSAVLSSPKLSETEIENFARMQNVSEDVLRVIGTSRVWVKNYNVVAALVKNPRTPTAVSLALLPRLQERDVKGLTVNRNVPESVRLAARKFLAVQQERRS